MPTLDFASRYDFKSKIDVLTTKTKNIIHQIYILTQKVSKELNHLAAILHVYAGGVNFMK